MRKPDNWTEVASLADGVSGRLICKKRGGEEVDGCVSISVIGTHVSVPSLLFFAHWPVDELLRSEQPKRTL